MGDSVICCDLETETSSESKLSKKIKEVLNKHLMTIQTLSGITLGTVLGISLRSVHLSNEAILLIAYPGELFLRILQFLLLPLVLSCLIAVSASINPKLSGKMTFKTVIYFAFTSMLSAVVAIFMAFLFRPGDAIIDSSDLQKVTSAPKIQFIDSMLDLGRNFFPDNLFQAFFEQPHTVYVPIASNSSSDVNLNIVRRKLAYRCGPSALGLVTFSILFGSVLNTIDKQKGKVIKDFFDGIFQVLMKLTAMVMWLNGIGMCSIIAGQLLRIGNLEEIFSHLAIFLICAIFAIAFHQIVMLPAIYYIFLRRNPFVFYRNLGEPWITSFAVSSSAVALPAATKAITEKAKCDERISKFVLSLGVTLNNNGTAIFLAMSTVFIARLNGISLDYSSIIMVVITVTTCSMSMPSIPGGALLILMVVLSAVDVDTQYVAMLFAIDWIIDRLRTTSNVMSNCFAAAIIEKQFKRQLEALDSAEIQGENTDRTFQMV